MLKKIVASVILALSFTIITAQNTDFIVKLNGDTIKGEIKCVKLPNSVLPGKYKLKNAEHDKLKFSGDEVAYMKQGDNEYILKLINPEKKKSEKALYFVAKSACNNMVLGRTYDSLSTTPGGGTQMTYYHLYEGDRFVAKLSKKNYKELLSKYFACDEKWLKEINHNKKLKFNKLFKKDEKYGLFIL